MSERFAGRVALVTGGSSGIGAAVAARLLREGVKVATLDLAKGGPDGVLALSGDVRRSEEIDAAVRRAEAELGPIDILVCSAGISGESLRTVDVDDDELRRDLAINADGTFFANRAVIAGMTERNYGRIVNVASIAGKEGNPMAAGSARLRSGTACAKRSSGSNGPDTRQPIKSNGRGAAGAFGNVVELTELPGDNTGRGRDADAAQRSYCNAPQSGCVFVA